jgi:hypothetical protein
MVLLLLVAAGWGLAKSELPFQKRSIILFGITYLILYVWHNYAESGVHEHLTWPDYVSLIAYALFNVAFFLWTVYSLDLIITDL